MIAMNEKANMTKVMAVIAMMAVVFAGVAVLASDSTDAADSKITYISGEINADTEFGVGTIVVVNGNLTVVNGAELKISDGATFTVNEGVTLTVNGLDSNQVKSKLTISDAADVTINGTVVINENGVMDVVAAADNYQPAEGFTPEFIVNGTLTFQNGTESVFTDVGAIVIGSTGTVNVTSVGTRVSEIGNVAFGLIPGATLNMRGLAQESVMIVALNPSYDQSNVTGYVAGANLINESTDSTTMTSSRISNLTFTSTSESSRVYDADGDRVNIEITKLDMSGTLQNGDRIYTYNQNAEEIYYNSSNVNTRETVEVTPSVDISGTLNIARTGYIEIDSNSTVSGTVNVTMNTADDNNNVDPSIALGSAAVVTVSGSITFNDRSYDETESTGGSLIIDGGSVTIVGCDDPTHLGIYELYGAYYYTVGTNSEPTTHIVDLSAAIEAATADNTITEINVFAMRGSESAEKYEGGYIVESDFTLPENVTLNVYNALIIPEEITVTIPENAFVATNGTIANGVIVAQGTLIDNSLTLALYNGTNGVVCEVRISTNDGATITYTSLRLAIANASAGDSIELAGDATIEADLTIPADITVVVGEHNMTVTNNANLTVDGILDDTYGNVSTTYNNEDDVATGTITINNMMFYDGAKTYNVENFNVSGIYAADIDLEAYDASDIIMSMAVYAENSADIAEADAMGTISVTQDTTLNAGDLQDYVLNILGTVSVTTLNINGYDIEISGNGILTGTVAAANGSISLNNIKANEGSVVISNVIDADEGTDVLYISGTPASIDRDGAATTDAEKNVASLSIVSGTVAIDRNVTFDATNLVSFGVAADTTLDVAGILRASEFSVAGTADIQSTGSINATDVIVTGTLNMVTENNATGTVTAGDFYIGTDKEFLNQTAASVNGDGINYTGTVYVYAQATVEGDITEDRNTQFYIEDTLWMTAYGQRATIANAPIENAIFNGWVDPEIENFTPTKGEIVISEHERMDADIDYDIYTVTVLGDNGIGTVAIDGNVLLKSSNMFIASGLTAGTHTISYTLKNGYSGEATISVDGQTISGNSFTLSGTSDDDRTVQIVLSGTEASVQEPVDNSDDGMGITDYLLIILVILVIVLAIFVALRMMRS